MLTAAKFTPEKISCLFALTTKQTEYDLIQAPSLNECPFKNKGLYGILRNALGVSTLRDRDYMTAAMLLETIFAADLPPERYDQRPGSNAQQPPVEVEEVRFCPGQGNVTHAGLTLPQIPRYY